MAYEPPHAGAVRFGTFEVDVRAGELRKHGTRIKLQDQPLQILAMLLERPGEVVTREELRQKLWPADTFVDFDHGLNNAINRLRDALGDAADTPRFIETLPRRGYRFLAPVEAEPVATLEPRKPQWQSAVWGGAIAVLAITAAVVLGLNPNGMRGRVFGRPTPARLRSLAVLPLENLAGDPSQEYFADGMTDALTTELAQIGSIQVISRTSAIHYKGSKESLREIARELNVDGVVEGTVQRSGNRVSITSQLIDAKTDRHLWAKSYEMALGDILSVESRVARDIAQEMQVRLTPQEQARLSRTHTVDPEAYEYYLRASPHSGLANHEDNAAAIELLERAVAADPSFAQAQAALAVDYTIRAVNLEPLNGEWEEKAFAATERALALNPDLAEAYLARGRILWTPPNHFPHERAIREYRHALTLNPNLADAHQEIANIYNHIGLFDKGREEIEKAVALDPLNTAARFRLGINLLYQGKYQEALTAIQDSKRFFPRLWVFQTAFAMFQLGRRGEATVRVDEFMKEHPEDTDLGGLLAGLQALFAAAEGRNTRAQEKIQAALKSGQGYLHFHHTAYAIASAYSLMNKPQVAMTWLERAADEGFPCYPLFEIDPNLNNLRQNPRFIEFMARQKKQWEYFEAAGERQLGPRGRSDWFR
jgi:TolB-like protein/DNA-binding winged helix-turn-helix (wHTH) protein